MIPVRALLADLDSAICQGNEVKAAQFRTAIAARMPNNPKLTHEQQLWFWRGQLSVEFAQKEQRRMIALLATQ